MAYLISFVIFCCLMASNISSQQSQQQQQQQPLDQSGNYPYYMQSPVNMALDLEERGEITQRSLKPMRIVPSSRKLAGPVLDTDQVAPSIGNQIKQDSCLYNKSYFAKLDECLARKPYPTIGLPAFKNEDLLIKRGLNDRRGCVFVLNNGLFKNYQISRYSLNSDSQCLDGNKIELSMDFTNVTLAYLWTLRCLNSADQMLEDATQGGHTNGGNAGASEHNHEASSICVGSSQNFGFATLQLSNIEAQIELATDVYKNWRVTNATVVMLNPTISTARAGSIAADHSETENPLPGTNIKDYVFESLDGDELNWRYLHLFQNWSRNRIHTNFLDQYRRFLWISLQRCLSDMAERLPVKPTDVFASQKYT